MRKKKLCISVRRERKTEQPPRLFDLTGLQREANRIYGYTAKQTLDLAQALYEKRLLTYPRTDSNFSTCLGVRSSGGWTVFCRGLMRLPL